MVYPTYNNLQKNRDYLLFFPNEKNDTCSQSHQLPFPLPYISPLSLWVCICHCITIFIIFVYVFTFNLVHLTILPCCFLIFMHIFSSEFSQSESKKHWKYHISDISHNSEHFQVELPLEHGIYF